MSLLQLMILALVQGVTEFLPISSSGHLILVPPLLGWPDQGLALDMAVHVGTLGAVLLYFRRDTARLARGVAGALLPGFDRALADRSEIALFWALAVATIPVVAAGLILQLAGVDHLLRMPAVVAAATLFFAVLLWLADRYGAQTRTFSRTPLGPALFIGLAQVLALIPGTSRAGITITAARALGYERREAARFSMLLSIPVIIAGGLLLSLTLAARPAPVAWGAAGLAALLAFLVALMSIHFLMRWLARASMTVFVLYRIGLGLGLFAAIGAGWL